MQTHQSDQNTSSTGSYDSTSQISCCSSDYSIWTAPAIYDLHSYHLRKYSVFLRKIYTLWLILWATGWNMLGGRGYFSCCLSLLSPNEPGDSGRYQLTDYLSDSLLLVDDDLKKGALDCQLQLVVSVWTLCQRTLPQSILFCRFCYLLQPCRSPQPSRS